MPSDSEINVIIYNDMAILSRTKIVGALSSAKWTGRKLLSKAGILAKESVEWFRSGFDGYGWKIWEFLPGKWKVETDYLTVRGQMLIVEMLISKIRAIVGALGITQGNGKIKSIEYLSDEDVYLISVEDEMSFVAHDFIRCQQRRAGNLIGYWVECSEIRTIDGVQYIVIPTSEFSGEITYDENHREYVNLEGTDNMCLPAEGDDIIQFGNSVDETRRSAIYLHADEAGQPSIDVLFDIQSKSFAGCVKCSMGGNIPGSDLKGFYVENGMLKGTNEEGSVTYCIYPDGSATFGGGSVQFLADRSGYLAGGAIRWAWNEAKQIYEVKLSGVSLSWEDLDEETQDNLTPTSLEIVFSDLVGNRLTMINAYNDGTPKINKVKATLYKRKGLERTECADYWPRWSVDEAGNAGALNEKKSSVTINTHAGNIYAYWKAASESDRQIYCEASLPVVQDGDTGASGTGSGNPMVWKGELASHPSNPVENWWYKNTTDGYVYIYSASAWRRMISDGSDGLNGLPGADANSLYITYHDNPIASTPDVPTGDGTTGGWHTDQTADVVWCSQKLAKTATEGTWGTPFCMRGGDGTNGTNGTNGDNGENAVNYTLAIPIASIVQKGTEVLTDDWDIAVKKIDGSNSISYLTTNAQLTALGLKVQYKKTSTANYVDYNINNSVGASEMLGGIYLCLKLNNVIIDEVRLGVVLNGNDGKAANDIVIPDWIQEWDNNKTKIGDTYMLSPQLFTGTKNAQGQITGILQGKDCVTINNVKRSGIFGFDLDDLVFALDPVNRLYLFSGSFYTPFVTITEDNSSYLTDYRYDNGVTYRNKMATDILNLQINHWPTTTYQGQTANYLLGLPTDDKYLGAECNIFNQTKLDLPVSCDVS